MEDERRCREVVEYRVAKEEEAAMRAGSAVIARDRVAASEAEQKYKSAKRKLLRRDKGGFTKLRDSYFGSTTTSDNDESNVELNLIIKADVAGTAEALVEALEGMLIIINKSNVSFTCSAMMHVFCRVADTHIS